MKISHILTLTATLVCTAAAAQQTFDDRYKEQARELVGKMTLEEKVLQVCFESPAIDRLDIPSYNWWNECLHGVARAGIATVFPQAIGMSATFDAPLMERIGEAISDEARAKYNDYASRGMRDIYQGLTMWSPNINIFRDPRWGRGMETYGEDPYLSGELGVGFIRGLQGNDDRYLKTVATAKHFVVHSGPERGRHSFDSKSSGIDFYQTYTPHFRKAIQQGGVYSVMCAYNRLNGEACCGSVFLDNLLRNRWGLKGYIVSDCGAIDDFYQKGTHELVATSSEAAAMGIRGGTDLCCGSTYKDLLYAVRDGIIAESEVDRSVERIMEARLRLGMFAPTGENPYDRIPYNVVDCDEHRKLTYETAVKSMVLLKNEGILPLSPNARKIAVVGPNADDRGMQLGNYNGFPSYIVTALEGIRAAFPDAEVVYAPAVGVAPEMPVFERIAAQHLRQADGSRGVQAELFRNRNFEGKPAFRFSCPEFSTDWFQGAHFDRVRAGDYSIRLTAWVEIPETGEYLFGGEQFFGCKMTLCDSIAVDRKQKLALHKGDRCKLSVEYTKNENDYPLLRALWHRPADYLAEAKEAVKDADYVICCMGINPWLEGEQMDVEVEGFDGGDRLNIELPKIQREAMQVLYAVNPKMVMVLFSGSALAVNWEAENLPALVQAWYPGQEGGHALADLLSGAANPSGRLPVTFYKSSDELGDFHNYAMEGKTYRFFRGTPLFEFGHGLSYSEFSYSKLRVARQSPTSDTLTVEFDVRNTGSHKGDEVVQLYLAHKGLATQTPLRSLETFRRIALQPGESRRVSILLSGEQLATVDSEGVYTIPAHDITLYIGGSQPSAERIRTGKVLQADVRLTGQTITLPLQ